MVDNLIVLCSTFETNLFIYMAIGLLILVFPTLIGGFPCH